MKNKLTVARVPPRGNVSYDVDVLFVQLGLVQGLVDPVQVLRGVVEVEEQPEVEVVAHVRVDGDQSQARPEEGL